MFRAVKGRCPDVDVSILSRFSGDEAVTRVVMELEKGGLWPRNVWNKNLRNNGPGTESRANWYVKKIKEDVGGLDQRLVESLRGVGVRVVHPLERRLARALWRRSGAALEWPRPVVVLRGETRSGKDMWARAFSAFIDARHPLTGGAKRREGSLDLGQVSGRSGGESGKIALFGWVRLFFVDGPRGFCQRHGKSYLTRRRRSGEGGGGGLLTGRAISSAYRWAWCRWYSRVVEVPVRIEVAAGFVAPGASEPPRLQPSWPPGGSGPAHG